MKAQAVRQLFTFAVGGLVGVFTSIVVLSPWEAQPGAESAVVTPRAARPAAEQLTELYLDPAAPDGLLAQNLEQGQFDGDWGRVSAVARALRERGVQRQTAAAAQPDAPDAAAMVLLDHQYRRRAFQLELASRDNLATRTAASNASLAERERRLLDLLDAPTVRPQDEVVRRDAALLLGRLGTERARAALLRALEDPQPARASLAAEALGRSDDTLAIASLLRILERDPDPTRRARAADALAWTRDLAEGGVAAEGLARTAREDRDVAVRTHAIAALVRADLAGNRALIDALTGLLADEGQPREVRGAVVATLRGHHTIAKSLPDLLVESLEQLVTAAEEAPLRIAAIDALGESSARPESITVLEGLQVTASGPDVQQAVAEALSALRARAIVD